MNTSSIRRSRRTPTEWAALVEQASTSPLSTKRFCEQAGVSVQSLYSWRAKLRAAETPPLGFTPILMTPQNGAASENEPACCFEIELRNGRIVRVSGKGVDMHTLRSVIEVAEGGTAC
jgi:transposase-like protein